MEIRTPGDWEKIRARGKVRFVLLSGVVGRGLPMGLVIVLAIELLTGEPIPQSLVSWRFVLRTLLAVALFSVSGCISAAAAWRLAEKRFG